MNDILSPISDPLRAFLFGIHNQTGLPWAWSIIVLTILVRLALSPLVILQVRSMRGMAKIGPELKEVREKYKSDAQKMQQEMMALYKQHGVNPFSSCLPMLPQLPVFFALYYVLQGLQKQIKNGTIKGDFSFLGSFIPYNPPDVLGIAQKTADTGPFALTTLILIYILSQVASTLILPQPGMDPMMRRLFILMPVAIVFFSINFPVGLMIYWITSNIWTFFQQLAIRKIAPQPVIGDAKPLIPGRNVEKGKGLQGAGRTKKAPKKQQKK